MDLSMFYVIISVIEHDTDANSTVAADDNINDYWNVSCCDSDNVSRR